MINIIKENKYSIIYLISIIISAFWIRFSGLSEYYLNNDEAYDIANSMFYSPLELIRFNFFNDGHPPLARIILSLFSAISTDYMFLRVSFSIMPIIASIIFFYFMAKKLFNYETAVIGSFLIAYSPTIVMVSQTARQYSVFILFYLLALYYLFSFLKSRSSKDMWLYLLFISISFFTHYQAALLICAAAIVLLIKMLLEKEEKSKIAIWIFSNSFIVLSGAIYSYFQQKNGGGQPQAFDFSQTTFLIEEWLKKLTSIFNEFLLGDYSLSLPLFILLFLGFYSLIKERRFYILAIFSSLILVNITTEILRIYPFFGIPRRLIFYFPFIIIFCGYGMKFFIEALEREIILTARQKLAAKIFFTAFFLAGINFYYFSNNDFLRDKERIYYFVLKKSTYETATQKIREASKDDIFIADGVTANYFILKNGRNKIEKINEKTSKINFNDKEIYFNTNTSWPRINNINQLRNLFADVNSKVDLSKINKIWYISLGWDSSALANKRFYFGKEFFAIRKTASNESSIIDVGENLSFLIYSLKWNDVKEVLDL